MTTTPTTPEPGTVTLAGSYAADLAALLHCLSEWIDTEHRHLEPLLDRHNYDIDRLHATLTFYAGLLDPGEVTF